MPNQDTSELKNKIINFLRQRGPSLPVHIAKEVGLSILFASAFLSELLSERQLKMSHMKIGSSKLHFLEGQENKLEKFGEQHLKSREKDAFILLREKKFLKESEQHPAIRVALKEIKDFAIPFNRNGEIIWRYYLIPESEFEPKVEVKEEPKEEVNEEPVKFEQEPKVEEEEPVKFEQEPKVEEEEPKVEVPKEELDIFDEKTQEEKPKRKPARKKSASQKKNELFFNKVKEYLTNKGIEIVDIESFNKADLSLRVRQADKIELLVAYNKRRITDTDIVKASKKAAEVNLPYTVLSLGEPLKKMSSFIDAIKNLSSIEKIE